MERSDVRGADGAAAIVTYWTVKRPNGTLVTCSVYRTTSGLELRVGLAGSSPTRTAPVKSMAEALALSDRWKVMETGASGRS